jgi:chaperonin cofactor prefoldin
LLLDNLSIQNFKAVQQSLNGMTKKIEEQEKRINTYAQSHQMLMTEVTRLQQEVCILKAMNAGSGPTKVHQ